MNERWFCVRLERFGLIMIVVCLLNVRQQLELKLKDKEKMVVGGMGWKGEDRFFRGVSGREIGEKIHACFCCFDVFIIHFNMLIFSHSYFLIHLMFLFLFLSLSVCI